MATFVPAKRATEFIFYVSLVSQADTKLFQNNPTIAAGDFIISKDGGATANLATLPAVTPAASDAVKITLGATEMTSDQVMVIASDAAGAEWCDASWNIQTAADQIDDLTTPAEVNTQVSDVLKTDTIAELAQGVPATTPTFENALMLVYMALRNRLDIDTSGGSDFKEVYNDAGVVVTKKTLTDDGTIYSEAQMITGP